MKKLLSLLLVFSILFSLSVSFADIIAPENKTTAATENVTNSGEEEVPVVEELVSGEETAKSEENVEQPTIDSQTSDEVVEESKNPSPLGAVIAIVVVVAIVALVILVSKGN